MQVKLWYALRYGTVSDVFSNKMIFYDRTNAHFVMRCIFLQLKYPECYLTKENINLKDEYKFKCHSRYKKEDIHMIGYWLQMDTTNETLLFLKMLINQIRLRKLFIEFRTSENAISYIFQMICLFKTTSPLNASICIS